jgi:hypothetical protein
MQPINVSSSSNKVPAKVMQTAETYARGQTLTLNMTDVGLGFSDRDYYLAFYFAEIDPQAVNQSRIFDLYVNEQLEFANISVLQLSGGLMYSTLEIIVGNITLRNTAKLVQLIPHADSALGPILNAYELFEWISMSSLTFPSDGKSIDSCTLKPTDQCCPVLDFVGSALQGRDIIVMHPETGQSLVSLHLTIMWSPLSKCFSHN